MVDAARLEGSATVIVSCGVSDIELSFGERGIAATTGQAALSLDDVIVLEILGWRRSDDGSGFVREWRRHTSSDDVADDVLHTAVNAYQCDAVELNLSLRAATAAASH